MTNNSNGYKRSVYTIGEKNNIEGKDNKAEVAED